MFNVADENQLVFQKEIIVQIRFVCNDKDIADPVYVQFKSSKKLEHELSIEERMFGSSEIAYVYDFKASLIQGKTTTTLVEKTDLKQKEFVFDGILLPASKDYLVDSESMDFPAQYITQKDGNTIALENIRLYLDDSSTLTSPGKYFDENKVITIPYVEKSLYENSLTPTDVHKDSIETVIKISNEFRENQVLNVVDKFDPFVNDLFWLLVAQVKEQYSNIIHLPGKKVQEELGYSKNISHQEFVDKIQNGLDKLGHLSIIGTDKDDRKYRGTAYLFNESRIYLDNFELEVQVNDKYLAFFNNFTNWTRFALPQYVSLKSIYSKKLFRYFKQYRTVGRKRIAVEELRLLLGVSANYKVRDINNGILKLVMQELAPYFQNLNLTYDYSGRKIIAYNFSFVKEKKYTIDAPNKQNPILDDIIAVGNIRSNPWLDDKMKKTAIDRYRNKRLGTTSRIANMKNDSKQYLSSYFLEKKTKKDIPYSRDGLADVDKLGITQLRLIVRAYEVYNIQGRLTTSDRTDLQKLEEALAIRCLKEMARTQYFKKPFRLTRRTIVERLLSTIFPSMDEEYLPRAIERTKKICRLDVYNEIVNEYGSDPNRVYVIERN